MEGYNLCGGYEHTKIIIFNILLSASCSVYIYIHNIPWTRTTQLWCVIIIIQIYHGLVQHNYDV